ncbi:MAG: RloB family protein [Bacteroidales bacterium]|jgi:hypothetical protein|nr:RloB family protein [Bacteroidales bacterium]
MILTNRFFERIPPSREAKNIYIFSEGAKREYQYFEYFRELDSRINIEIYKLHPHEDNSPLGLLSIAEKCILVTAENPNPKYNYIEGDEVWIVLDIDKDRDESRLPQIENVQKRCAEIENWNLVKSNPCFEVWLYYHIYADKPKLDNSDKCSEWKRFVNNSVKGGFDSRKHPIFVETASVNAKNNHFSENNMPDIGSTEVYSLADSIVPLLRSKLKRALNNLE